ncbi:MAG: ABC transporter ATP-binding protein [Eubacteriales bacterium]
MADIIRFDHISKKYGEHSVLDQLNLAIASGEFVTIIGKSGCGKTTALKMINGLNEPDSGSIFIEDVNISTINKVKLRREIGYAIQNVGLFPHLNILKNVAYVPNLSKETRWNKEEKEEKVVSLLESVGLSPDILYRFPRELSGGQKQRVGIARALASKPKIILMDEPFGAVDEITREQLQVELLRIHEELKMTVLFVTHDVNEALKLGTKVLILNSGKVEQYDSPSETLNHPSSEIVKDLVLRNRELSLRV